MDFGGALRHLRHGEVVALTCWAPCEFVVLSPGCKAWPMEKFWAQANREHAAKNGGTADVNASFTKTEADKSVTSGWLPDFAEIMSDNWVVRTGIWGD